LLWAGVNVRVQSLLLRGRGRVSKRLLASLLLFVPFTPLPAHATSVGVPASGPIYEAIVIDAETGQVLRELNPDAVTYPASLTKMMTLYLTFEAINQGRLQIDQYVQVSANAAAHAPSRLGLQPGEVVMVRDLILAIVTKSANDAAAVLAETLGGGSEANFAAMMNQKAQQLGMTRSHYSNASGLPDPEQLTSARDIARLALALYHDFPREYRYFAVKQFDFQGELINGHDHMLDWYPGADGIKTGFTVASGYNLATSAVQNGRRLIGVILGGRSIRGRDEAMAQMLDLGFADLARQQPVMVAQQPAPAPTTVATAAPTTAPAVAQQAPQAQPYAAAASAAVAPSATAPTTQQQASAAPAATAPDQSPLGAVADAFRQLATVGRAEAAPVAREPSEEWGLFLGGYRAGKEAEHVEREVAAYGFARGKVPQIVAPSASYRYYQARLFYFTALGARAACGELRRQHIECTPVAPPGVKVASR
jgi:D-alanyl-D-alanine carboxypeptidase